MSAGHDEAVELLGEAARAFDALGYRLDAARGLLLQGRALRRAGRRNASADVLTEAHGRLIAMGATPWALQAEVEIRAAGRKAALLQSLGDDLRFVLITSRARVTPVAADADEAIVVLPSAATKCERCWHWRDDVGHHREHPTLCGRCVANLFGTGEPRVFA